MYEANQDISNKEKVNLHHINTWMYEANQDISNEEKVSLHHINTYMDVRSWPTAVIHYAAQNELRNGGWQLKWIFHNEARIGQQADNIRDGRTPSVTSGPSFRKRYRILHSESRGVTMLFAISTDPTFKFLDSAWQKANSAYLHNLLILRFVLY